MSAPLTATDVRARLCDALDLDLVGPRHARGSGSDLPPLGSERLSTAPSRWYLTGFLAPKRAAPEAKEDVDQGEEIDSGGEKYRDHDPDPVERRAAVRARFPSSMGLSLLVPEESRSLEAIVRWGDYQPKPPMQKDESAPPTSSDSKLGGPAEWQRTARTERIVVDLPAPIDKPVDLPVPNSDGIMLALALRPVTDGRAGVAAGVRAVSLFVVNDRDPVGEDAERDRAYAFQVELEVHCREGFVPRTSGRGRDSLDYDERLGDLQYRDVGEWAVGHGVSTEVECVGEDTQRKCHVARTCWIPSAEVERVNPAEIADVELGMEELAKLPDAATAKTRLAPLVAHYRTWLAGQRAALPADRRRKEVGEELLRRAELAAKRIDEGIALLADDRVLQAFRIANEVMAVSQRQRQGFGGGKVGPPHWRPFQLAFLLLNLSGVADFKHVDRETVDLLFFPTGGGKTEAYLGLAAFTLVLRRLQHPGITSAGVSVLMRYTLRLLTLDQLSRASTMICALELLRQQRKELLGEWPFEIGLWVGRAATPNRMGSIDDNSDHETARAITIAFQNNSKKKSPIPLENCPWCNARFTERSFVLVPNQRTPTDLDIWCRFNRDCPFSQQPLPIIAVDEPIYRRLPCFLIATVDKFAAMPWTGEVGAFFGRVDRYDPSGRDGFYGPCTTGRGAPIPGGELPPPDLVIQDELHLISGPLGTIAGLYETALDWLSSRRVGDQTIRPKVIASTATVRRADAQIQALFGRSETAVFPPPGLDRRDSFFAKTVPASTTPARRYVGIAAPGRSLKVILLRSYLALLGAAQKLYEEAGGERAGKAGGAGNPADAYMTLVGYFNSLRELGGSRRIVEDEVKVRAEHYESRTRVGEETGLFADRTIARDPIELTSRVATNRVADAKRRLALPHHEDDHVDVALATNMISVGLDITRLGLMVVLGQPKTSAEYIQASSRVGRDPDKPGVIVTLLNVHRPRDRSHYERFGFYHATFYRSVEASSVTPFSPRALDRALAGTVVALARLGHLPMTPPLGAGAILTEQARLGFVVDVLAQRAVAHAKLERKESERLEANVRTRTQDLLQVWNGIANELRQLGGGGRLQYQKEVGDAPRLLYAPLDPELANQPANRQAFRANRSMRDVEASVNLWVKRFDDVFVENEEDDS